MEKQTYGATVRNLLSFANIKFLFLANYLGYDVSYISKWCNGTKLPIEKSIDEINNNIAELLSEEITQQNKVDKFIKKFKIETNTENLSKKSLKRIILTMLEKAYSECFQKVEKTTEKLFLNRESIKKEFNKVLMECFSDNIDKINIYVCLDIVCEDCKYILSKISQYKNKDTIVNVTVGLDLKKIKQNNFLYLKNIYYIINKNIDLNIEFYNLEDIKSLNLIVIEEKLMLLFSLDNMKRVRVLSENKDKENISNILSIFKSIKKADTELITSMTVDKLLKKAYRTNFYLGNKFNFLLTMGFEFFIPSSVLNTILSYAEENQYKKEDIDLIKKLMITWDEIFESSTINFFILKSALYRYLQERKIYLGNIEYIMSIEEIEEHYSYLIGIMKKNPNIKFYLVDDTLGSQAIEFRISVFCNETRGYIKNISKLKDYEKASISIATNQDVINGVNELFNHLKNMPNCKEYFLDDIERIWAKYKNIALRFIELNN